MSKVLGRVELATTCAAGSSPSSVGYAIGSRRWCGRTRAAALEARRRDLGENHPDTLLTIRALGVLSSTPALYAVFRTFRTCHKSHLF